MPELTPFLKKLISLPGLSGYEGPVREAIAETWRPLTDALSVSKVGSLHGLKRGGGEEPRRSILLAAHMDGIGLMVTQISAGFLHFTQIGGVDPRILPGQRVTVYGRKELPGIVVQPSEAILPPRESGRPVEMEHLLIDTGLTPEEVALLVRPGDLIAFASQPIDLPADCVAGHSLDNRASVAAVTQCLMELQHMRHTWDVWAVATVQEETAFLGSYTSPFELRPDLSIVIDVTFAKGPGASDYRTFPLGKGLALGLGPNIHPAMYSELKKLADEIEIPYGIDPMPQHSGTDAYAVQVTAEGIPTGVISIPLRYMHTPVEVISIKDVIRCGHLMAEFIARMTPNFMTKINWEDER